jgi:hypothetical protein
MTKYLGVVVVFAAGVAVGAHLRAQAPPLFAVELTRGPAWDAAKTAGEQPGFSEHSANIRRLTDSGALAIGARYGDKGLLVVRAADEKAARAHFAPDPTVAKNVFALAVHPFSVFRHGCTDAAAR